MKPSDFSVPMDLNHSLPLRRIDGTVEILADGTGAEVEPELNDTYGMAEVQEEDESDSADE